ncbi:MAG: response regulator [bacterium]|nr:response regulator [bacterium]
MTRNKTTAKTQFHVALVEDDENIAFLTEKTLSEFHSLFVVESFSSGEEFLEHLDKTPSPCYDSITIDYSLPGINGIELLSALKERFIDAPVIFITHIEQEDLIHQALSSGACDYIIKSKTYLKVLPLTLLKSIEKYRLDQEHLNMSQQIQQFKDYYECILNTLPFAVLGLNQHNSISLANTACQTLFTHEPADLIGRHISDLFEKDFMSKTALLGNLSRVLQSGQPVQLKKIRFNPENRYEHILDLHIFRVLRNNAHELILLFNDITENVLLEQKLFQTEKLASLGKLLTSITHELNNRLSPILGYTQLILGREEDEKKIRWLNHIEESTQNLKSVSDSLLYFSPLATHHHAKKEEDINEIIHNVIALLDYKFKSDNIGIVTKLEKALPLLTIDRKQIIKVLLNILNNSCEAMEGSNGTVTITTQYAESECIITIEDTGCGIPENNIHDVFDPFFTTKQKKHHIGLGLCIAFNIIQQHKGRIQLISEKGKGTKVIIVLPIPATLSSVTSMPAAQQHFSNESSVLIIEDDQFLRDVMKDILEDVCNVDIVADGKEAIKIIGKKDYSVILSDIRMPGMNGQELYHWIKKNHPGLEKKVVFTTGDTYDPDTNKFLDSIENSFLSKPFNIDDLKNMILKACQKSP